MPTINVPIDASQISAAQRGQQSIKVAVQDASGIRSQIVEVGGGKAQATLEVDGKSAATIAIGPATSTDADLFRRQTLTATVSAASLSADKPLTLPPFVVTAQWWGIWLIWCRTFTIQGQLKGSDGNPVPNAQVKAFNVDYFWWWSSLMQVGNTAVSDANGHFTITFEWCCYWLPIWWWNLRFWRLDPVLLEKILPVLKLNPGLTFSNPTPDTHLSLNQIGRPAVSTLAARSPSAINPLVDAQKLDPTNISTVGAQLLKLLPAVPELVQLRLWPWFPWTPWLDCGPNIIFQATQNCGGATTNVIVDETVFQARLDIPTNLSVTLIANAEACTIPTTTQVGSDCFAFTEVCGVPCSNIGISGPLAGYAYPGASDRPFAEGVNLFGLLGAGNDYYQLQYRPYQPPPAAPAAWQPVPAGALGTLTLGYFDSTLPFPNNWVYPLFPPASMNSNVGTVSVYESVAHYETTHPPNNWGNLGAGRTWFYNIGWTAAIQTDLYFTDGPYEFQVVGFTQGATELEVTNNGKAIPGCGGQGNNDLVTFFDNRIASSIPGSVHIDTTEPGCSILSLKLNGVTVTPCGIFNVSKGQPMVMQFTATDPDGHLDFYDVNVQWGEGNIKDVLSLVNSANPLNTLAADAGNFKGPTYAAAKSQGAVAPMWKGGTMTLTIADATEVFTTPCAYLLTVTAWKRNIVGCDSPDTYYNTDTYSFTINVV